ncbi:hypothetical protein H0H87_006239 [Tephrocybe sp. NHM501043]|nr:hypothetical protein H0H87_006239 [Tephrocybe sp. NHM501043]
MDMMRLAGIVQGIKSYLTDMKRQDIQANGDDPSLQNENGPVPPQLIPSDEELNAALKVLRYLQLPFPLNLADSTPLNSIVATIEAQISLGSHVRKSQLQATSNPPQIKKHIIGNRKCYMCLFLVTSPHSLYPALCVPCGNFNTASSELSLPPRFNLSTKTALVTGGRINLGYRTALRLLRGGCNVIVSTRYPYEAEIRYLTEPDAETWQDRLRIVGADFRTAKDVFALIGLVKGCLREWQAEKLDILINNAAQTLTDRVDAEVKMGQKEDGLKSQVKAIIVVDGGYTPRLRGGMATVEAPAYNLIDSERLHDTDREVKSDEEHRILIKPAKSSWTQKLSDIPYEDIISAHSINTLVPLILMRELLPVMSSKCHDAPKDNQSPSKPIGYIINVSSREGIPENRPSHPAKAGHHVHTNMSKAALNMLTETEAGEAWRSYRIAVNSVDPGYMSADPEWMELVNRSDEHCPIGWEDGAARILWPVVMGEIGKPVWGRFLKHFRAIEVKR